MLVSRTCSVLEAREALRADSKVLHRVTGACELMRVKKVKVMVVD